MKLLTWRIGILGLLILMQVGCGSSSSKSTAGGKGTEAASSEDSAAPIANPRDQKLDASNSATLTVFSSPPGCMVFVDFVPVRNENESLAVTPCAFAVGKGMHSISVERPGGKRATQAIDVSSDRDLDFDVSSTPGELDDPSILNAPLFEAAVGRVIPLASLNTAGKEQDPFLSADGLTIYFVSDRDGIKGVFSATRPTPYHDFETPTIVQASTGADLPASPSASSDGRILVYAVPEKSRLWQLTRPDATGRFDNKEITRNDEQAEREWRSAQLSGDGLRIYWTEESGEALVTRAAVRSAPEKLFGKTLAFDLPGRHPHLSSDGLRQYIFDGSTLKRARRGSIKQPFGPPELVVEMQPEGYTDSPRHRQFWVTEDEQWLYFCDNPNLSGNLFVVRLSDGPLWGRSYLGKSVADKMMVAATEPEEKPKPETTPTETVDPKTLPLPYTTHWGKLVKLLEENKGSEAVALVKQAQEQKDLEGDRLLLEWDLNLAEALEEFDRDLQRGLESLKPGSPVRVGGTRFEFDRLDSGTLHLKLKDKEVTKKLADLSPGERVSLADGPEKADAAKAYRFGVFLFFQGKLQQSVADGWFKKGGDDGEVFYEHLASRALHQGKAELARGKVSEGIKFLDSVAAIGGPNTEAAKLAAVQRATLYDALEWKTVGPRKWQKGELGEFIADATRANGAYLMSEQKYGDFDFSCEWKVTGPTAMGGIYLRYSGQGKPLENGAKIHLANDSDLRKMDRFATGSLFAVASPNLNASLPEGKWNTLRIQARGTDVKVWINDKEVLQSTLAKNVPESGYIMLDGVAGGISYRKVLVFESTASEQK